jgi:hypothetical protein
MLTVTETTTQKVKLHLSANGTLDHIPTWVLDDSQSASLVVAGDGMSCDVVAIAAATVTVTASATAGGVTLSVQAAITITVAPPPPFATQLTLTADAPVAQ